MTQPLSDIPLFEGLNSRERRRVVGALRSRVFKAGEILFQEGESGDKLFLVKEGLVRIYTGGRENGQETSVLIIGKPGDLFGELALVDGEPRSASAKAVEDTVVYTMARDHFNHHLEGIPRLAYNFIRQMSQKMRSSTTKMDSLANQSVYDRLVGLIYKLAIDYGKSRGELILVEISLNQTEIASLIGATRESTNRAMQRLKNEGILENDSGRFIIYDMGALKDLAD